MAMSERNDTFESIREIQEDATKQKLSELQENIASYLASTPLDQLGNSITGKAVDNKGLNIKSLMGTIYAQRLSRDIITEAIAGQKNTKQNPFRRIIEKVADAGVDMLTKQKDTYDSVLTETRESVIQQFRTELDDLKKSVISSQKDAKENGGTDNHEEHDEKDHTHETQDRAKTEELLSFLGGSKETVEKDIVQIDFLGKKANVHSYVALALKEAEEDIKNDPEASKYVIEELGSFNRRKKRGGTSLSNHSLGLAIDINSSKNHFVNRELSDSEKKQHTDLPDSFVAIMKKHGFGWGGDRKKPYDAMHFEYSNMDLLTKAKEGYNTYITKYKSLDNIEQYLKAA